MRIHAIVGASMQHL